LDSLEYEVEFRDGSLETFSTNTVVENMYAQIDPEGKRHRIFAGITDHRNTVKADQVQPTSHKTTKGWDLLVEWGDGTTSWIPLKDMKNSNPIEAGEYAVAQQLAGLPAFAWWVRTALRARDQFINER
jgi:hypothetical protein